jgi:hypothetical protein
MFHSDYLKGLLDFKDCSTLVNNYRKNERGIRGTGCASAARQVALSQDPDLDLNLQILARSFHGPSKDPPLYGLRRLPTLGQRCLTCAPLFPKLVKGPIDSCSLHRLLRPFLTNSVPHFASRLFARAILTSN